MVFMITQLTQAAMMWLSRIHYGDKPTPSALPSIKHAQNTSLNKT